MATRSRASDWERFYNSIIAAEQRENADISYSLDSIDNIEENSDNMEGDISVVVTGKNTSMQQQNFLKETSNLSQLILKRAKCLILVNITEYPLIDFEVRKEIRALIKHVSSDEVVQYLKSCFTPIEEVKCFIEIMQESPLTTLLLHQMKFVANEAKFKYYNEKVLAEWERLTSILSEDEVIIYAYNALKRNASSS